MKINKDKFILIIRIISSIIVFLILLIYIIIIILEISSINVYEKILISFYYNFYTRDLMLGVISVLLHNYYDSYILGPQGELNEIDNHYLLTNLTHMLNDKYHNFTEFFFDYNLAIESDFNLIYKKRNFMKLRGYWQVVEYEYKFSSEMDYVIFNIFQLDKTFNNNDKIDFANFLFFKGAKESKERVKSTFIKLLYYLSANAEFTYKYIFDDFEKSIYNSYKVYINNVYIYIILEIIGLIFYIIFYVIVFTYLYLSNSIVFKNIIFLFLDLTVKEYDKSELTYLDDIISLKLSEFKNIIDDFDLNMFDKYIKKIDKLNKNIYMRRINDDNNQNINIDKKSTKSSNNFNNNEINKKENKNNNKKGKNDSIVEIYRFLDNKNKGINNSSHNYLMKSNLDSFNKLSNNSMNRSNEILVDNNDNSKNYYNNNSSFNNNNKKKQNDNEDKENFQDILLNKTNKSIIFIVKIYCLIMILALFITISFICYKILYILSFKSKYDNIYIDLNIFTNRYTIVYKYYNILRTLFIYPSGKIKEQLEEEMEHLNEYFEEENKKFINIVSSHIDNYNEIKKLYHIIKDNKNNSTSVLKKNICQDKPSCLNYLESNDNIFDSGVEFAFKSSMTQIYNIYLEYKKLNNKMDIEEIKSSLIYSQNSNFISIGKSLNYLYINLIDHIFINFEKDGVSFLKSYIGNINNLNTISIVFTFGIFLFLIIFIIISISKFTEPIKESSYRINCSFYFIKKYCISSYEKIDSFLN